MADREVNAPDGRTWVVTRAREGDSVIARLSPRSRHIVRATTEGPPAESRRWFAADGAEARRLVEEVALALRTGAEGPLQPED